MFYIWKLFIDSASSRFAHLQDGCGLKISTRKSARPIRVDEQHEWYNERERERERQRVDFLRTLIPRLINSLVVEYFGFTDARTWTGNTRPTIAAIRIYDFRAGVSRETRLPSP